MRATRFTPRPTTDPATFRDRLSALLLSDALDGTATVDATTAGAALAQALAGTLAGEMIGAENTFDRSAVDCFDNARTLGAYVDLEGARADAITLARFYAERLRALVGALADAGDETLADVARAFRDEARRILRNVRAYKGCAPVAPTFRCSACGARGLTPGEVSRHACE